MTEPQLESRQSNQRPDSSVKMKLWGAIIVLAVVGIVLYGALAARERIAGVARR